MAKAHDYSPPCKSKKYGHTYSQENAFQRKTREFVHRWRVAERHRCAAIVARYRDFEDVPIGGEVKL